MKTAFSSFDRKSLADQAFDALFQSIISGDLAPGQRLNEVHIAAEMGVSRAPVREAIQRLRQKGLILASPGKQPTVVRLTPQDVRQLYSVRVVLEHAAIDEIRPEDSSHLAAALAKVIEAIRGKVKRGTVMQVLDEEIRFHEVIVAASNNTLLVEMYHLLLAKLRMTLAVTIDKSDASRMMDVADCHTALLAAFEKGDLAKAKALLSEHIWASFPAVKEHPIFAQEAA